MGRIRWLMFEQSNASVSKTLLVVMVFWLTVVFISFGLFAPRNATAIASLFAGTLSVSGAIFLILEMYMPYRGLVQISSAPLRSAWHSSASRLDKAVRQPGSPDDDSYVMC